MNGVSWSAGTRIRPAAGRCRWSTEAGGLACEDILRRRHALEARWLADLPEPDRQELLRLLGVAKGLLSRAHVPPRPVDQVPGQGG